MKIKILYYTFFIISQLNAQQNLVLNPSFEDVNVLLDACSFGTFNQAVNNWTLPTQGTSDIHHMSFSQYCLFHPLTTSAAPLGYQQPRTGNSIAGFAVSSFTLDSYREYLQGELSSPLQVNKTYEIKFYLSLGQISNIAIQNIGVKFYEDMYYDNIIQNINQEPDVEYNGVIVTNKEDWVEIKMNFTPITTNLKYFVIGNFKNDENSLFKVVDTESFIPQICYYLIDDVSISLLPVQFNEIGPFCQGENFTLPTTSLDGISGTWSPEINNQQTTTYTFTPTDSEYESIEKIVEIIPIIKAKFNEFETICYGDESFQLPLVSLNGVTGYWDKSFNNTKTDTYIFTPNGANCIETTEVKIEVLPDFNFDVITYCRDNDMHIEVINIPLSTNLKYEWFLNGVLLNFQTNSINIDYLKHSLLNQNKLEIIVTKDNFCSKSKIIEPFYFINCGIQKGISPNGDGNNDYLDLKGLNVDEIKIYNRYGKLVYQKVNYVQEWFGQSNDGKTLPSGTYFYTVKFKYSEDVTGYIQLVNEIQ